MKLVIPMGGKGTRLKPHTHTRPKPLIHLAGKPVLGHILDSFSALDIEEVIFITGAFEDQVRAYVDSHYDFKTRYIAQKEAKGVAHALYLAQEYFTSDVLIVFADTLFEADLSLIASITSAPKGAIRKFSEQVRLAQKIDSDGILYVKEVMDPSRFGVTFVQNGYITKIIEKPETPVSNLALIGLYYVASGKKLAEALEHLLVHEIKSKGEYYLTDALQFMIDSGMKFIPGTVKLWNDCGTVDSLLDTNRHLLTIGKNSVASTKNCVIIPPVLIEDGAEVSGSIIGPFVSVASGAIIEHCIISDSIISQHASLRNVHLRESLIGEESAIEDQPKRLNMGDHSQLSLSRTIPDE